MTEYAIILALIIGLAALLSTTGLKDRILGVYSYVEEAFEGDGQYAQFLGEYGGMSRNELLSNVDAKTRLAIDRKGLENMSKAYLGMTLRALRQFTRLPNDTYPDSYYTNGKNGKGVLMFKYGERSGADESPQTYLKSSETRTPDAVHWMQGDAINYDKKTGQKTDAAYSGPGFQVTNGNKYNSDTRFFFSDNVLNSAGSEVSVYSAFHFSGTGDDAVVTGVHTQVDVAERNAGGQLVWRTDDDLGVWAGERW